MKPESHRHYLEEELYQRLKQDSGIFSFIEQGSLDGLWYWDLEKPENEWMNDTFWKVLGYPPEEMAHSPSAWQDIIHEDDLRVAQENFYRHYNDPSHPYDQVVRYKHRTGSTVWIRCRGLIIRNSKDTPVRMLGAHQDITRIKEAEEELKHVNERFMLAAQAARFGMWDWIDVSQQSMYWNPKLYQLLGYTDLEIPATINNFKTRLVHPDDRKHTFDAFDEHLKNQQPLSVNFRLKTKDNGYRRFRGTGFASRDRDNKPLRMAGCIEDIHDAAILEQQVNDTLEQLSNSNSDLKQFAYIASHDLKAPLRAIKQLAGWIVEDIDTPNESIQKHVNLMNSRISRMEHLLEDLLNYSRVDQIQAGLAEVNIADVIEETFESYSSNEQYKFIREGEDHSIYTQRPPLELVLRNLVSNAVKHNDKLECMVKVSHERMGDFILIKVFDNGPGVPERYKQKIFELFTTLNSRDHTEGSGLGLSITKKTIDKIGGKIWLETETPLPQGYNCLFCIKWPVEIPQRTKDNQSTTTNRTT